MAKVFRQVQKHPNELSAAELRRLLGDLPDSQVIRTILVAEVEAIRGGLERERRTMRNMWYDLVKPALSRAGILNKTTKGGKPVPWPDKLSDILGELVDIGHTTYEELRIVDGSRQRQVALSIPHTVADINLVGPHFPWVILFTEKDTIWGEVEALASLYGVSAISGGGQPSYACTENVVKQIVRHPSFEVTRPEALLVLSLTDYDPFGYKIANAIVDQIARVVSQMPADGHANLRVRYRRLGLVPDQLTAEERQAKAYEPKDEGLEAWFAETGGVDGQRLGLELDALPLSRLRGMFADGIEQNIDLEKRRQDLREAYVDLLACELLLPDFDAKRRALRAAIVHAGMWAAIEQAPIPGDLFKLAAAAGWRSINPSNCRIGGQPLFNHDDDLRLVMTEALQKFGQ